MSADIYTLRGMRNEIVTPPEWVTPLEDYLAWLGASRTPASTMKLRSYHLRRFARDTKRPPYEHDFDSLVRYLNARDLGPNSLRSIRTTLKSFYGWARLSERMRKNPAAHLPVISSPTGKPRPAPVGAVRAGVRDHDSRTRLMVMLAAYAGLRCCEIAQIHTDDLQEDLIGLSLLVHGKGRKRRVVPLRDDVAHLLSQIPRGYVFEGRINGHLSAARVSEIISEALPPGVTAHMLRHWFASSAYVSSGNDIRAVQELLGHASVATTQIYTAIESGALRRAVVGLAVA